jgi:hypothetical protein
MAVRGTRPEAEAVVGQAFEAAAVAAEEVLPKAAGVASPVEAYPSAWSLLITRKNRASVQSAGVGRA